MTKGVRRLICYCAGGLANRLRPLASCYALAQQTGRQLSIVWPIDYACGAPFSSLFDTPLAEVALEDIDALEDAAVFANPNSLEYEEKVYKRLPLIKLTQRVGLGPLRAAAILKSNAQDIIIFSNSPVQCDTGLYLDFLKILTPTIEIQRKIDDFVRGEDISEQVVGAHVRGTDFTDFYRNVAQPNVQEAIRGAIESNPGQRFFVCSDSADVESALVARYPENVVSVPKVNYPTKQDERSSWVDNYLRSEGAIAEALVDLAVLSITNFRIPANNSTFSLLAKEMKQAAQTAHTSQQLRLHVGGKHRVPSWTVFDAMEAPHVDIVGNCMDLRQFEDNTVDEIYTSHVLEHLSHTGELQKALGEFRRVLKPGGMLHISVPDMEVLFSIFSENKNNIGIRLGVVNILFGSQANEYDFHKIGLSLDLLGHFLRLAGFSSAWRRDSFGLFDDMSEYVYGGKKVSLNCTARK